MEFGGHFIDWIHPSYRDLVIQELENDEAMGAVFLEHCSFEGLRLAISVAGGAAGERRFPLMKSDHSWAILEARMAEMLSEAKDDDEITEVLKTVRTTITSAVDLPDIHQRLLRILDRCCSIARTVLDRKNKPIRSAGVKELFESTMCLVPPLPMPSLLASWKEAETELAGTLDDSEGTSWLNARVVSKWTTLIKIIYQCDQRLLVQVGFPSVHAATAKRLCSCLNNELDQLPSYSDPEECLAEATRMQDLSSAVEQLVEVFPKLDRELEATSQAASRKADYLEERYRELSSDETPPEAPQESRPRKSSLDLERLFSDL
jgi:hypothetical protein